MMVISKIRRFWAVLRKKQRQNLTLIKIDRCGNRWYCFSDLLQIGIYRKMLIEDAQLCIDMRMSIEEYKKMLENIEESAKKNDIGKIIYYVNAAKIRLEVAGYLKGYIQLIAALFLLNDEKDNDVDSDIHQKKIEILQKDIELCDFFLEFLMRNYMNFSNLSSSNLLNYLQKAQKIIEQDKLTS